MKVAIVNIDVIVTGDWREPFAAGNTIITEDGKIAFVGDELQTDMLGAREAGMQTVWMTYRQRLEQPSPLGQFLGVAEHLDGIRPDHEVADWSEFLAALA